MSVPILLACTACGTTPPVTSNVNPGTLGQIVAGATFVPDWALPCPRPELPKLTPGMDPLVALATVERFSLAQEGAITQCENQRNDAAGTLQATRQAVQDIQKTLESSGVKPTQN